jgi:hypothetical protein
VSPPLLNKKFRSIIVANLFAILAVTTACQRHDNAIHSTSATLPDLQNITLQIHDHSGTAATLVNGEFKGDHLHLQVLKTAAADLNQDSLMDGAIMVWEDGGGSGTFRVLCLLLNDGENLVHTDKAYIGDRIRITNLDTAHHIITVNYLDRGSDDAFSVTPYIKRSVRNRVQGSKLEKLAIE